MEISNDDLLKVFGSFSEASLDCIEKQNDELRLLEQEITDLKRTIQIKDKYCQLIVDLGFDYDGLNSVEDLKTLINELVGYANRAIESDDKTAIYISNKNKSNILGEDLEDEINE